jgi:poly-gamma-glutamate capsule biosynthesis protein CapA/YwtB (metallophosphatase superfamily)
VTTLAAVGDLVLMRPLAHVRRRPADSLLHAIDEADLVVGNLEVALTAVDDPQRDDIALRGDPALVADLAATGVDAVSLANNHCGDHGWRALRGLADDLRRAGIRPLGIGTDADSAFEPAVLRVGGLEVAVVAATCVGLERTFAAPDRPGMAGLRLRAGYEPDLVRQRWEPGAPPLVRYEIDPGDRERLLDAVRRARRLAPVALALMHWGVTYTPVAASYQPRLAADLVDAGASAVFGCHAHELQGVQVHRGAPIFHGLGSFVFGYDGPLRSRMAQDAAVAVVDLGPDGRVTGARMLLGRLQDGEPVRGHPERCALLAEILGRSSTGWGASARLAGDALEIDLGTPSTS